MKINGIGANVSHKLATIMLGTGLLMSTMTSSKAQGLQNDVFRKESTEIQNEKTNKDHMKGELILGSSILAYLGCLWIGNKKHNQAPNK